MKELDLTGQTFLFAEESDFCISCLNKYLSYYSSFARVRIDTVPKGENLSSNMNLAYIDNLVLEMKEGFLETKEGLFLVFFNKEKEEREQKIKVSKRNSIELIDFLFSENTYDLSCLDVQLISKNLSALGVLNETRGTELFIVDKRFSLEGFLSYVEKVKKIKIIPSKNEKEGSFNFIFNRVKLEKSFSKKNEILSYFQPNEFVFLVSVFISSQEES